GLEVERRSADDEPSGARIGGDADAIDRTAARALRDEGLSHDLGDALGIRVAQREDARVPLLAGLLLEARDDLVDDRELRGRRRDDQAVRFVVRHDAGGRLEGRALLRAKPLGKHLLDEARRASRLAASKLEDAKLGRLSRQLRLVLRAQLLE